MKTTNINLSSYKTIIFDLDNTLIDQLEYDRYRVKKTIEVLASRLKMSSRSKKEIFNTAIRLYVDHIGYNSGNDYFEQLISYASATGSKAIHELKQELISSWRSFRPKNIRICLLEYGGTLLRQAKIEGKDCIILTDGNMVQQENKISCIQDTKLLDNVEIHYAIRHGGKSTMYTSDVNIEDKALLIGDGIADEKFSINNQIDMIKLAYERNGSGKINETTLTSELICNA